MLRALCMLLLSHSVPLAGAAGPAASSSAEGVGVRWLQPERVPHVRLRPRPRNGRAAAGSLARSSRAPAGRAVEADREVALTSAGWCASCATGRPPRAVARHPSQRQARGHRQGPRAGQARWSCHPAASKCWAARAPCHARRWRGYWHRDSHQRDRATVQSESSRARSASPATTAHRQSAATRSLAAEPARAPDAGRARRRPARRAPGMPSEAAGREHLESEPRASRSTIVSCCESWVDQVRRCG